MKIKIKIKLLVITITSLMIVQVNAQTKTAEKSKFAHWATANTLTLSDNTKKQDSLKVNKTLTTGDYLVKSSNNLWIGTGCAILSGFLFYQGAKQTNSKDKDLLIVSGAVTGIVATVNFPIIFSINLRKAGKSYNKERK